MRPSPIGGDAVLKATDISATGGEVASRVQMQLTGPADIKAAHAYFQPTGAEAHLPAISGLAGADASAVHVAGHLAGKATEGAAIAMAAKTGEGAAMAAAHQAGAQAISPMIQMIMRMPGHLGLMTSFFEALGHFFLGQDILNGLGDAANMLTQHAEGAMHAISSAAHDMGINIELFPQDGDSILNTVANATSETHGALLTANNEFASTLTKASVLDTNNMVEVGHNALSASGYAELAPGHSFSSSMNDGSQPAFDAGANDKFLAWDTGSSAFRPTLSGVQQPIQMPQTAPQPTIQTTDPSSAAAHAQHATGHELAKSHHHDGAKSAHHSGGRGRLLDSDNNAEQDHAETAQTSEATSESAPSDAAQNSSDAGTADGAHGDAPTEEYTVQHGDNLWDIARTHLGDANRWTEIYHLNQDVLGDNPALIHAGTTLHLPGSDSIASGDYVVKSGDNLWDISQSHLGGGQHWSEVYHANEGVIGSNPSLIHPGQHLTLSTDGATHQLAAAPDTHAHSISHAAANAPHAHHTLAQAHPHASTAPHHLAQAHQAPTQQLAQAASSQGMEHAISAHPTTVASAETSATSAPSEGMHAQAGSLASLQGSANPALKFENLSAE